MSNKVNGVGAVHPRWASTESGLRLVRSTDSGLYYAGGTGAHAVFTADPARAYVCKSLSAAMLVAFMLGNHEFGPSSFEGVDNEH